MRHVAFRLVMATLIGGLTACGTADTPTAPSELSSSRRTFVPLAPTLTVLRSTDAGAGSLREAVTNAVAGDVIGFADSITTITLLSEITVTVPLTIQGRASYVILDGGNATRLFRAQAAMTVRGMTLQNAKVVGDGGGAILSTTLDVLTLEDVDLRGNSAARGGAVYAEALSITNVNAEDNRVDMDGGAIGVEQQLTAVSSTFTRNYADYGAAMSLNWPSTIDGVTFTGNVARYGGGAIAAGGAELVVSNSIFTDNSAIQGNGGAIRLQENIGPTSLAISGSTFTNNFARSSGGALDVIGPLTIEGSRFEQNTGPQGGGVYQRDGATSVTGTVFEGNTASGSGGALSIFKGALVSRNNEFLDNQAFSAAAIIIEADASAELINTTFLRNVTEGSGGAVYAFGALSAHESRFLENRGTTGGAVYALGVLTVTRGEFVGNTATEAGGAISAAGNAAVVNSTFAQNGAPSGAAVWANGKGVVTSLRHVTMAANAATAATGGALGAPQFGVISLSNSLLKDSGCGEGFYLFVDRNLSDSSNCQGGASVTVGALTLAPLALNGGATRSMAIDLGSAAVDGGVNCTVADDQRGVTRPKFASCDLGAYEFDVPTVAALALDPSGTVNIASGVAYVSGTVSCSRPATIVLKVGAEQAQKVGKITTVVRASSEVPISCGVTTTAWSAALTPATGAFGNTPMTVTAGVAATDPFTTATPVRRTGVKISWSKR